MVKFKGQKEPLQKNKRNKAQSSIDKRWREDAKWFKEDAKNHPEKYQAKDDEKRVSSDEMEEYFRGFIKEGEK